MDQATQARLRTLLQEALALLQEPEVTSAPVAPVRPPAPSEDAGFAFSDYGRFYDFLRGNHMLGPKISAEEFSGCDAIIKACALANWPVSFTAYALATAYHETAHTMQPIPERGGNAYFTRLYDIRGSRPELARRHGNTAPGDGPKYKGRGYVQLTWKTNYANASVELQKLGIEVDLVREPDRALEPQIAALVMVVGMERGWFTARKLRDDLPPRGPATLLQFKRSRDIINGTDKDDEIAAYAVDFQTGLQAGGYKIAA